MMVSPENLKGKLDHLVKAAIHYGHVAEADWPTAEDERDAEEEVALARFEVDKAVMMIEANRVALVKALEVLGGQKLISTATAEAAAEVASYGAKLKGAG